MSQSQPPDDRCGTFEETLLRAGRGDAPPRSARRKVLVALGVGTGGALGAGATASSAAAGPSATVAGAGFKFAWVAVGKWVGLAALTVGTAAISIHVGGRARRVDGPPLAPSHAENVPSAPLGNARANERGGLAPNKLPPDVGAARATEPAPAPVAIAAPSADPLAPVMSQPRSRAVAALGRQAASPVPSIDVADGTNAPPAAATEDRAVSAVPLSVPAPSSAASVRPMDLSQEVAALESSRAALRAGNAILALRQLDGYSAAFPHGVLEPESILLRIEAQIARGDRAAAAALGRRFLIAFPRSPLAPRVRALVGP